MFKPNADTVMVEVVVKKLEGGLHLPDTVKSNGKINDLIVKAVGDNVTLYEIGDEVMTPLPKNHQIAEFDDGDGKAVFIFWKEGEIFGKFEGDK